MRTRLSVSLLFLLSAALVLAFSTSNGHPATAYSTAINSSGAIQPTGTTSMAVREEPKVHESPLKQFKSGVPAQDIACEEGMVLVINDNTGEPACVTMEAAQKLAERGWGKIEVSALQQNQASPPQSIAHVLPNGTGIIELTGGQAFGPLAVQNVTQDSVSGLNFREYPLASNRGSPVTLHVGDSVNNGCTLVLTLEKIENKTAWFAMKGSGSSSHNCPICLSGKTLIGTPAGKVNVKDLKVGMSVWTADVSGHRQQAVLIKAVKIPVTPQHVMVHMLLADGRELVASAGHPTPDGKLLADMVPGDALDNSYVKSIELVPYGENYTYDILPSGPTGFYWADGVLMASTLK